MLPDNRPATNADRNINEQRRRRATIRRACQAEPRRTCSAHAGKRLGYTAGRACTALERSALPFRTVAACSLDVPARRRQPPAGRITARRRRTTATVVVASVLTRTDLQPVSGITFASQGGVHDDILLSSRPSINRTAMAAISGDFQSVATLVGCDFFPGWYHATRPGNAYRRRVVTTPISNMVNDPLFVRPDRRPPGLTTGRPVETRPR